MACTWSVNCPRLKTMVCTRSSHWSSQIEFFSDESGRIDRVGYPMIRSSRKSPLLSLVMDGYES
jgi:hypothetical protein